MTGFTNSLLTNVNRVSRVECPKLPFTLNAGEKLVKTFQYNPPVVL